MRPATIFLLFCLFLSACGLKSALERPPVFEKTANPQQPTQNAQQ